uniref:ECR1_N domain-containing protein n=1 Tax=Syphacia muris TaxID=451379 RepID=A0A0N5B0V8_9BILA
MLGSDVLSSEPSTSSVVKKRFVVPGDRLLPISDNVRAAAGTYEMYGYIYASLAGTVCVFNEKEGEKEISTIEVRKNTEEKQTHIVPYVGSIVTAKVLNLGPRYSKCAILCVESSLLSHEFEGVLRKENLMESGTDKAELHLCVHPGDIILARVIGFGENQMSFLLSIAEAQLGVVSAMGDLGERMVPISFTEVRSVTTSVVEKRKVARIPSLNIEFYENQKK